MFGRKLSVNPYDHTANTRSKMNFQKLPIPLLVEIVGKCNFNTIIKMKQTCSTLYNIVNKNGLDEIDAGTITFHMDHENCGVLQVSMVNSPQLISIGKEELTLKIMPSQQNPTHNTPITEGIDAVLSWVRTANQINFDCFNIDEIFAQELHSIQFDWKKVAVIFDECTYRLPKCKVIAFWKMFNKVTEAYGKFTEEDVLTVNDELLLQTLPTISFGFEVFGDRPNITDNTLEFLAVARPPMLEMNYIANYTLEGVKRLFQEIIESRDSSIYEWYIGSLRLDIWNYNLAINEFKHLENKFTNVIVEPDWLILACKITVEYTKQDFLDKGRLSFGIIKPHETLTPPQLQLNGFVELPE